MDIHIEDLNYDSKRKMVTEDFTPEMDSIVQNERKILEEYLRAQTIMSNLGWSPDDISKVIERVCKYGYVAYEIVYSDDQKKIVDLVEIDAYTLTPSYTKNLGMYWEQHVGNSNSHRILLPGQVIYLSNEGSFNKVLKQLYKSI